MIEAGLLRGRVTKAVPGEGVWCVVPSLGGMEVGPLEHDGATYEPGDRVVLGELDEAGSGLVVISAITLAAAPVPTTNSPAALAQLSALLAKSTGAPVPLLALGSSTTKGLGASTPSRSYLALLTRTLQRAHPSGVPGWEPPTRDLQSVDVRPNLPGVHAVNGAISGAWSNSYLPQASVDKAAILQPRLVLHMIGANDYGTDLVTPAQTRANITAAMLALDAVLASPAVHIIVGTYAMPAQAAPDAPWDQYLAAMREAAAGHPHAVYFDTSPAFVAAGASGPGAPDPYDLIGTDQTHATDAGHALIAEQLARQLPLSTTPDRPAPRAADRFARLGAVGNLETGQAWAQQVGTWQVAGGYVVPTAAGNLVVNTGFSDAVVSALATYSPNAVQGVIAKSNDSATRIGWYLNGPSSRAELWIGTGIAWWSPGLPLVAGREYALRVEAQGDQVRCYLDGQLLRTQTLDAAVASTYGGHTQHGLRANSINGTPKFRALSVDAL